MLRAGINNPDNPLVLIGLSEGNIVRLKNGQPIKVPIRSFGVDLPGHIAIIYGKTELDMKQFFQQHGLLSESSHVSSDPRLDQEAEARARHQHILVGTVGLPRSGKTTWALSQAWPIVCPDAIRYAVHGQRFISLAEPFVWAIAKAMVRALFLAGHQTVILDATNTTRKRREEWVSPDWGTFWKLVDTPADVCRQRAEAENDSEILPVIDRMAGQWEPLGEDELRW